MNPYYEQDGITIYHGDCRVVLGDLYEGTGQAHRAFDLLLTDPPYGIGIAANPVRQKHARQDWDNATTPEALMFARSLTAYQIIWGGNYYDLPPSKSFLVWDKVQPEDFTLAMAEQAWTSMGINAKIFRKRVVGYAKDHPTAKPEALMDWCLRLADSVFVMRSVLDPFMGSGTTLVSAKRLGKTAVGIDLSEAYCEIAAKRLSQGALNLEMP